MAGSDIIHSIEEVVPYIILAVIVYGAVRFIMGIHHSTRKAGEAMPLSGRGWFHLKVAAFSFLAIPLMILLAFMLVVQVYIHIIADVMGRLLFCIIFAFAVFFFIYGIYNLVQAYDIRQQEKSSSGGNREGA